MARNSDSIHHRRATSTGGSDHPDNRAELDRKIHNNFHDAFLNLCVPQKIVMINSLIEKKGYRIVARRSNTPLHEFVCPPTYKIGNSKRMVGCCITYWGSSPIPTRRRANKFNSLVSKIRAKLGKQSSEIDALQYLIVELFDPDYKDSIIEPIPPAAAE